MNLTYDTSAYSLPVDTFDEYEWRTRRDGWWLGFFFFVIVFGPQMVLTSALPAVRFIDVMVLLMLLPRWLRAGRYHGGLLLGPRIAPLTWLIFIYTAIMVMSMAFNVLAGNNPFFYRDLFYPLQFFRAMMIAAIVATHNLGERQVRQFFIVLFVLVVCCAVLGIGQKMRVLGGADFLNRFYSADYEQIEEMQARSFEYLRTPGTFGNSNVFSACMCALGGMMIAGAIHMRGLLRVMGWVGYLLIAATCFFATGSRTSIVALLGLTGFAVVLSMKRDSVVPALVNMVLIVMLLVLVRYLAPALPLPVRVREFISGGEGMGGEGLVSRYDMWKDSITAASKNLLFGEGATKRTLLQMTDNGYIYCLRRMGLLGLLSYFFLLGTLAVKGLQGVMVEDRHLVKGVMIGATLGAINHIIFELTGEFFWQVRYQEFCMAFFGLVVAMSYQVRTYHSQNYYMDLADGGHAPALGY